MNRIIHPHWGALALLFTLISGFNRTASASILYVKQNAVGAAHDGRTWETAFTSIQPAVNAAGSGDEVWVAAGTYVEHVDVGAGQSLYGGFAGTETRRDQRDWNVNQTVLDGGGTGDVVACHNQGTVLDGVIVRDGLTGVRVTIGASVSVVNCFVGGNRTGILTDAGGSVTSSDCTISGNLTGVSTGSKSDAGGENGVTALTNCDLAANGYGVYVYTGRLVVTRCNVSGTYGTNSIGIADASSASAALSNCVIHDNHYIGVSLGGSAPVTITGCTISRNLLHGVNLFATAPVAIRNCTLAENSGAGVFMWPRAIATVNNCTICANQQGVNTSRKSTLVNCVVAFNNTGVTSYPGADIRVSHDNVFGNAINYVTLPDPTGANGNISEDPRLSSPYHDIHLQPGSPCIDAGDDSVVTPDETDVYGKPRIIGAHVDIGSDESVGTTWKVPTRIWYVSAEGDDSNAGASWADAKKTVTGAFAVADGGDEIWVAKGTYSGGLDIPIGISMYGAFAGTETSPSQRDLAANVTSLGSGIRLPYLDCVVDGFVIRSAQSPGIDLANGGSVRNCVVLESDRGVAVRSGRAEIVRCALIGNGAGVEVSGGTAIITDCRMQANTSIAIALFYKCHALVTNCTILGNGRGVHIQDYGIADLANCIVAFNNVGLGSYAPNHNFRMSHNDVFANAKGNYTYIHDPTGTNGNISADPLFVNWMGGDYHLRLRSPCIDTGDDSVVTPGETDLDGGPRIRHAHVDMGCYEFPGVATSVPKRTILGSRG